MQITEAGMKYYEQLLDVGDESISDEKEYALREAFDWVDQNPDANADELVKRRKVWLTSAEFKMFSDVLSESELRKELELFRKALLALQESKFAL